MRTKQAGMNKKYACPLWCRYYRNGCRLQCEEKERELLKKEHDTFAAEEEIDE